jgi:hypothetical protein
VTPCAALPTGRCRSGDISSIPTWASDPRGKPTYRSLIVRSGGRERGPTMPPGQRQRTRLWYMPCNSTDGLFPSPVWDYSLTRMATAICEPERKLLSVMS